MDKLKIIELANIAKSKDIHIAHTENPNTLYDLLGFSKVKIKGEWVQTVSYLDINTLELYSRLSGDFGNFVLVSIRDR